VTSEVGSGTTFTLQLPLSLPESKKPEAALAHT